jgi:hypothetical protein
MFVVKGFSSGDIVSIKLINGDEIIARYEEEIGDTIKISKPLAVTLGPQGLGMIPWVFLGNSETYSIRKDHAFTIVSAKDDAASQYIQGTTGLALAK